jgi:hypothetical protein
MSLTSLLSTPHLRESLRPYIRNPRLHPRPVVVVPRGEPSPQRIGTAFDYAMRFGLLLRYPAVMKSIVASNGVRAAIFHGPRYGRIAERTFDRAMACLQKADLWDGLPPDAARAFLDLVTLDVVYRAGYLDDLGRKATRAEVEELQALYAVVPWQEFAPRRRVILNPTFGDGSVELGGADADLLVDDVLVDIKVWTEQRLDLDTVRQLVGYAMLARRFGATGRRGRVPVDRLGVYYARAGHFHRFGLWDCVEPRHERKVLAALRRAARHERTQFLSIMDELPALPVA